jgi:thiol-disulfide isomerase/thioredoxin
MDWNRLLRILAIASVVYLILSLLTGCNIKDENVVTWDSCSQNIGDHPCDFSLVDQNEKEFLLYDHIGKIIILDFSAMWCGPCQRAAYEVEDLQKRYDEDIVYVTILIENESGSPPTKYNIKRWADSYGIDTAPVLIGSRDFLSSDPLTGWTLDAWPQYHIIDKNMMLHMSFTGFSEGRLEMIIQDILRGEVESS